MIIRRTIKFVKTRNLVKLENGKKAGEGTLIQVATWWVLFLPIITIKRAI